MSATWPPSGAVITIPFSVDQFLENLAQYNEAVWPMQLVLYVAALACLGLLFTTRAWAGRMISLLLTGLWIWMAVAYHLKFFALINVAAWWFGILFALGATFFDWYGVVNDRLRFHPTSGPWRVTGGILVIFALVIYPVLSFTLGQRYPAIPTIGLPCPTTIFTIGILLFAQAPAPRAVFVIPVLWSAIGSLAALELGMTQDLALSVAGIIGLVAALRVRGPRIWLFEQMPHGR